MQSRYIIKYNTLPVGAKLFLFNQDKAVFFLTLINFESTVFRLKYKWSIYS